MHLNLSTTQSTSNPCTPGSDQSKNSRKVFIFIFSNLAKQIVPCESTAKEISFEWSHHGIFSTGSKGRTTLQISIVNYGNKRVNLLFPRTAIFG